MTKWDYVANLAVRLARNGGTLTGGQLARQLNQQGFRTNRGSLYQGGRGTYRLIRQVYRRFESQGETGIAVLIARAFTAEDGNYAY